jgi:cell division septation protein DedD
MAERRGTGLSFGQLITLTFGFLLASVVIFVFGLWVGRDLAEQRVARERDVPHMPVAPPEPAPPTVARAVMTVPAATPAAYVTATATLRVAATATALAAVAQATATRPALTAVSPTPVSGGFTVQAYVTDDTVRAVMLARTLRSKGYDATTATKRIGGVTSFVVRVGRFRDKAAAKAVESKLRSEEGLEAASVTAQ